MDIEEFTLAARGMVFSGLACGPKEGETVLLLHGFPQFADSWAEVAVALAKAGYRAIAIDQRGYSAGARPETVRDYAVDDLVADVLAIAIALGLERFHLAGHDWGGIVAWSLAARYPDRLQSLSIVSTPHVDALLEARRTDRDQKRRSRYITVFRLPFHVAEWLLLRRGASALKRVVAWHLIVRMRMFGSRLAFNLRTSSSAVANQLQVWAIPSWPGRAAKLLKKRGIPNLYFRRSDCEIIKVHLDVVARCFSS
nr:alpha/beta hydrolase [uncultured Rhizobium sp.]